MLFDDKIERHQKVGGRGNNLVRNSRAATVINKDARGRMSSMIAGTTTASYAINGLGQRITKSGLRSTLRRHQRVRL
jgi:predicted secreted protein